MRRTHAAAGLAIGFGIGAWSALPFEQTILVALISEAAALLPDWDLKLKIRHRGLTHSLLVLCILSFALSLLLPSILLFPAVLGYASHLVLDLLTVQGIELFYPHHKRIRLLKFRTNSRIDHLIGALMCCGALYGLWLVFPLQILRVE